MTGADLLFTLMGQIKSHLSAEASDATFVTLEACACFRGLTFNTQKKQRIQETAECTDAIYGFSATLRKFITVYLELFFPL